MARMGVLMPTQTFWTLPNNWGNGRDPWAPGLPDKDGLKGASYREAGLFLSYLSYPIV